jgi:hypothetical protein
MWSDVSSPRGRTLALLNEGRERGLFDAQMTTGDLDGRKHTAPDESPNRASRQAKDFTNVF